MLPDRPCPTPRCPNLKPCADHPRVPFANARRSTTLYRTARWKRESRAFLAAHPWCVMQWPVIRVEKGSLPVGPTYEVCGRPSSTVDHRVPHRGDEVAFFDEANFQALCHRCHNAKTGRETRKRAKQKGR